MEIRSRQEDQNRGLGGGLTTKLVQFCVPGSLQWLRVPYALTFAHPMHPASARHFLL